MKVSIKPKSTNLERLKENCGLLVNDNVLVEETKIEKETLLKTLIEGIKYERFFFITDTVNQTIRFSNGINQWIGYSEVEFTLKFYSSIIHEHYFNAYVLFTKAIHDMIGNQQITFKYMKKKFITEIALKHAKGHYITVKHTITCWKFDKIQNIPTEYIYEFSIWGEYDFLRNFGIKPMITDLYGVRLFDLENDLKKSAYKILESEKYFSIQELRILRKYASNPEVTSNEIALAFKISHNTVNIHNRKIIEKLFYLFPNEKLKTAREVAHFLTKENFI